MQCLNNYVIIYIREQIFRLFTARINAMFDQVPLSYIREQMFRLFTTRIKAMFEHNNM